MERKSKPIVYLDFIPQEIADCIRPKQQEILDSIKEDLLIHSKIQSNHAIKVIDLPIKTLNKIESVLKLFKPPKETVGFFLEFLLKLIFQPNKRLLPTVLYNSCVYLFNILSHKKQLNFTLPWEPVLQLLETIYDPNKRCIFRMTSTQEKYLLDNFDRLVHKIKKCLPLESGIQIYDHLKSFFGPFEFCKKAYPNFLFCLLRTDRKVPKEVYEHWMKDILTMLRWGIVIKEPKAKAFTLLAELAKHHYEIDWTPYSDLIFQQFIFYELQSLIDDMETISTEDAKRIVDMTPNMSKWIIYSMRPHPEGKGETYEKIKHLLTVLKLTMYPLNKNSSNTKIGAIESNVIELLLCYMCSRLRLESKSQKIKDEQKLTRVDVECFVNLIMEVMEPTFLYFSILGPTSDSLCYLGYLYPEKVFDYYIPKFLKYLDSLAIPHIVALEYLNVLIHPLIFAKDYRRRFLCIREILDKVMNSFFGFESNESEAVLDIISNIFLEIPLPHSNCMRNVYKESIKDKKDTQTYEEYLIELRKTNEEAFYYHELLNGMEDRVCSLLDKIFVIVEATPKLGKEEEESRFIKLLKDLIAGISMNATNQLFTTILERFKSFIAARVHDNCLNVIKTFIIFFALRKPGEVADLILPHAFQGLLTRKTDEKLWGAPLGQFIKETMNDWYEVSHKYKLKEFLSERDFGYYHKLIRYVLAQDIEAYNKYKEQVNNLLVLLILDKDRKKNKMGAKLFEPALTGLLPFVIAVKPLHEVPKWHHPLESYKEVGQFNEETHKVRWFPISKTSLQNGKELLERLCFKLGEFVLAEMTEDADNNSLALNWLNLMQNVIISCNEIMRREGGTTFSYISTILEKIGGKEISEYYGSLRRRLLDIEVEVVKKLAPTFESQVSQRLAKSAFKALVVTVGITRMGEPPEEKKNKRITKCVKALAKNPTIKTHHIYFSLYSLKAKKLTQKFLEHFERRRELPFTEYQNALECSLNLIKYIPDLVVYFLM